jgi:methylenetetrahydrofolate dehydrogenase (NADP+) / methenyltetrahydrofolate cyclohydrolase
MLLKSAQLVVDIKERQAREAADLIEAIGVHPKLAIIFTTDNPVIAAYVNKKKLYGADLGIDVDIHRVDQNVVPGLIEQLNADKSVNGMIVQLPLERPEETDEIVGQVAPQKDVDGLGSRQFFMPATPMAILWILSGHGIELKGKRVLLIGQGKLVGAPLEIMLKEQGIDVVVSTKETNDVAEQAPKADVIITATGYHGVINSSMVKPGAVVVDAGVASEGGKTVGDAAPDLYERDDISITPTKGGVGPLTVCALFENVIQAAKQQYMQ